MTRPFLDRDASAPRTSSFCTTGACVGVFVREDGVDVVDTKQAGHDAARLTFSREEWMAFVAGVRAGEFEVD